MERLHSIDASYYGQLETGALWLASRSEESAERETHLDHAARYARLRLDAAGVR